MFERLLLVYVVACAFVLAVMHRSDPREWAARFAFAACLPVVATNVGGVSEIVEDGRTGYLIARGDSGALADRVISLLGDREAARRMGCAARQHVEEKFSVDGQACRTIAVYQRVLATR